MMIIMLTVATVIDLETHKIPNWLTFTGIFLFLVYQISVKGLVGLQFGLFGMLIGTGLLLIPYLLGWTGAGDVKLLSAVGCAIGVKGVVIVFLFSAIFGGLFAIILLNKNRRLHEFISFLVDEFKEILSSFYAKRYSPYAERNRIVGIKMPYAVAISFGTGLYITLQLLDLQFPFQ